MNGTAVRDRLTERALGAVPVDDAQALDRHLAWCAACRKEAGELDRAVTTFAFASLGGALAAGSVAALNPALLLYPIYYCLVNAAISGLRTRPNAGSKTPAAIGIAIAL